MFVEFRHIHHILYSLFKNTFMFLGFLTLPVDGVIRHLEDDGVTGGFFFAEHPTLEVEPVRLAGERPLNHFQLKFVSPFLVEKLVVEEAVVGTGSVRARELHVHGFPVQVAFRVIGKLLQQGLAANVQVR